jgi:hypothetical protein
LENLKSARDRGAVKGTDGVCLIVNSDGSDTWTRSSSCAVEAAVALRRLGVEFNPVNVHRMLLELPEAMHDCRQRRITRARLLWVLYDLGDDSHRSALLTAIGNEAPQVAVDLITTSLRRGEFDDARRLISQIDWIHTHRGEFHFWPLCDYLSSFNQLHERFLHDEKYRKAREHGIEPPKWWSWRTGGK